MMFSSIVLLWVCIKLQAPIWCYVLVITAITLKVAQIIKAIIDELIRRKTEELEKENELLKLSGYSKDK